MSQVIFGPYMECSTNLCVDLVNSEHVTEGHDHLSTPADLERFISEHGLSEPPKRITRSDLAEIQDLRARLRSVFEAPDGETASKTLNKLLAESGASPVLTNHGGEPWHLHYSPPGARLAPRLMAECAMALSVIIAEDGFERLQSCDADDCADVFVDASKNRSRRYCSPAVCGNRASVAAYRARQRAQHG